MKIKRFAILLLLPFMICSCSGSSGGNGGSGDGDSDPDDTPSETSTTVSFVSYLAGDPISSGETGVGTDTIFVATFSGAVSTAGIESALFIVEGTTCDVSAALTVLTFDCGGDAASTTTCHLQPSAFLTPGTEYSLCVTNAVSPVDESAFSGTTVSFTTAGDSMAADSCTDTTVTAMDVITALPFDFAVM